MSKQKKLKRKSNNKRKLIVCFLIVLLILGGYFGYNKFFNKTKVSAPKVVDEIKSFNYVVNENDTKLFKKNFNELKEVLGKKEVDNQKYAEVIAKLFVIDFFSLNNKTSKNDVGGVQFVYSTYQSDFVDYARDGIYKQVKNGIDSKVNQNLPLVKSITVTNCEEIDPSGIFDSEYYQAQEGKKGYEVSVEWDYNNGSGFQTKAVLTIVPDNDKLSIAKMEE